MNRAMIEKIANAILYEGYMLYPYRASSIKNQQRFNFGVLYPEGYDTSSQTTECLVLDEGDATVTALVRYLRLDASQQAHEKEVEIADLCVRNLAAEPRNEVSGIGAIRISAAQVASRCYKLTVEIRNTNRATPEMRREMALCDAMISVHTILSVHRGDFPSLLDPPADLQRAAGECRNVGVWPVLAGEEGSHDAMLSSPIIFYDYPQVAPESPQNLFDGAEIDEILTLRILSLSDEEKAEIRRGDERTRRLLEKAETMPAEQLLKLHGALRGLPARDKTVTVFGQELRKGDRVRLWPQRSADIMDIALKGKTATIEAIEEDLEGNAHFAVVVEDDPGRDLGEMRQPGHRFFFGPEEIEPLEGAK